jgi:uncharacterized protein YlxP (DUF503 family)
VKSVKEKTTHAIVNDLQRSFSISATDIEKVTANSHGLVQEYIIIMSY